MPKRISAKKRGQMIRRARKTHGMNQAALAERCRVSRAAVSLWEKGETHEILIDHAMSISLVLQLPLQCMVSNETWSNIVETAGGDIEAATVNLSTKSKRLAAIWDLLHESDPCKQLIYEVLERYSQFARNPGNTTRSRKSS